MVAEDFTGAVVTLDAALELDPDNEVIQALRDEAARWLGQRCQDGTVYCQGAVGGKTMHVVNLGDSPRAWTKAESKEPDRTRVFGTDAKHGPAQTLEQAHKARRRSVLDRGRRHFFAKPGPHFFAQDGVSSIVGEDGAGGGLHPNLSSNFNPNCIPVNGRLKVATQVTCDADGRLTAGRWRRVEPVHLSSIRKAVGTALEPLHGAGGNGSSNGGTLVANGRRRASRTTKLDHSTTKAKFPAATERFAAQWEQREQVPPTRRSQSSMLRALP
jgi:hypothetical protein